MKIDRVTYRRLVTGDNYSNRAIEASAQVEDGDTPENALFNLSLWVASALNDPKKSPDLLALREEVEGAAESAEYWASTARRERERYQKTQEEIRARYRELGCLDAYMPDLDNIPF